MNLYFTNMDLIGFFLGFGVLQGIILAPVLVASPSGHRIANSFMAGLVLAIALNLLQSWLIRTGYYLEHPTGALLIPPLDFVWGPLLYLYAYTLTGGRFRSQHLLHFLPFGAVLVGIYSVFGQISPEEQRLFLEYLWSERKDEDLASIYDAMKPPFWGAWVDYRLQGTFFALHFGTYCGLVLMLIKQHNRRLEQHFSYGEQMNLYWLRWFTVTCLVFLLIFLAFNRTQLLTVGHFDVNALRASTPSIFLVLLIYAIGMSAIFQPNLIRGVQAARGSDPNTLAMDKTADKQSDSTPDQARQTLSPESSVPVPAPDSAIAEAVTSPPKYSRSAVSMEDANRYKVILMTVMQEQKLYLDSELTLPDLARETGLSPNHISQVINGQMNQNFFSFVNNYRIQLAKELLSNPDSSGMPVIELALEVGFKSKSSFYDAFRRATQMTPTQFKKSVQMCSPTRT